MVGDRVSEYPNPVTVAELNSDSKFRDFSGKGSVISVTYVTVFLFGTLDTVVGEDLAGTGCSICPGRWCEYMYTCTTGRQVRKSSDQEKPTLSWFQGNTSGTISPPPEMSGEDIRPVKIKGYLFRDRFTKNPSPVQSERTDGSRGPLGLPGAKEVVFREDVSRRQ